MDPKKQDKIPEIELKNDTFIFPQKISSTYSYKDSIKRVWDIFKNLEKISPEFTELRGSCKFLIGSNTYELNNEFNMDWYNSTLLHLTCIQIIEEENYKKICWRIRAETWNFYYNYSYIVHFNTIQKNCVVIWDIVYDDFENLPFNQETLINYHKIILDTFKKYETFLKKSTEYLNQSESIIINREKEIIWNIITDWRILHNIVPEVADEVECEGDPHEIGSIIKMKFASKDVECKLKVIYFNCVKEEEKWEYHLESFEGKPRVPNQLIIFNVIDVSENMCYLSFKHEFKQNVKYDMIQLIGNDKKKILIGLKNYLEKYLD